MFKTKRTKELEAQVQELESKLKLVEANYDGQLRKLDAAHDRIDALKNEAHKYQSELVELESQLAGAEENIRDLEIKNQELIDKIETVDVEALVQKLVSREDVPTFVLYADDPDVVKGLKVSMEWNRPLIEYLAQFNPDANVDEAIIQRWLITLSQSLIHDLELDVIEQYTENAGDEFA